MRSGSKFHRNEEAEEEGGEGWKDSYSDLMTDLLAIFVVLFSFAMMSQAVVSSNAKAGKTSIIGTEGSIIESVIAEDSDTSGSDNILSGQDSILPGRDSFVDSINTYISEEGLTEELSVTKQEDNTILLRVAASVLFESGEADITNKAIPILDRLTAVLAGYEDDIKIIRIEGHTDNHPISNSEYDSNWELSMTRSVNVVKHLLEISDIGPEKFSAVGYAEFHPVAKNDTAANRALNRRVDFIIETVDD